MQKLCILVGLVNLPWLLLFLLDTIIRVFIVPVVIVVTNDEVCDKISYWGDNDFKAIAN
jgi:hypothetical protein